MGDKRDVEVPLTVAVLELQLWALTIMCCEG